jgi:hypothetical protein
MFFSGKIKSMNYPDRMKAKAMVKSSGHLKRKVFINDAEVVVY